MTTLATPTSLPKDRENQTHVTVHALLVGGFWLPDKFVFQDCFNGPADVGGEVPDFAFMITHPTYGRALFDLGLRKHAKGLPPATNVAVENFNVRCDEDVVDVLTKGNISPGEISKIVYSHLHFDHTGDPTPFTNAEFTLGADGKALLEDAYPLNPDSSVIPLPENMKANFVDFTGPKANKIVPFGPYERAIDYYGDGSLYLIDSPGHMLGHMTAAARVAPDSFVFLAADTCHNRLCYSPGTRLICQASYDDIDAARATVQLLAKLNAEHENAVVILAHERERAKEMPLFPGPDLKEWALGEIEKRRKETM